MKLFDDNAEITKSCHLSAYLMLKWASGTIWDLGCHTFAKTHLCLMIWITKHRRDATQYGKLRKYLSITFKPHEHFMKHDSYSLHTSCSPFFNYAKSFFFFRLICINILDTWAWITPQVIIPQTIFLYNDTFIAQITSLSPHDPLQMSVRTLKKASSVIKHVFVLFFERLYKGFEIIHVFVNLYRSPQWSFLIKLLSLLIEEKQYWCTFSSHFSLPSYFSPQNIVRQNFTSR